MLPRDRAEQILADHAAGKPAGAIARAYGHSPTTIRAYVNGLRAPGEPAPRTDDFTPFAIYCRQRRPRRCTSFRCQPRRTAWSVLFGPVTTAAPGNARHRVERNSPGKARDLEYGDGADRTRRRGSHLLGPRPHRPGRRPPRPPPAALGERALTLLSCAFTRIGARLAVGIPPPCVWRGDGSRAECR